MVERRKLDIEHGEARMLINKRLLTEEEFSLGVSGITLV